jgi:hypothetical protein
VSGGLDLEERCTPPRLDKMIPQGREDLL